MQDKIIDLFNKSGKEKVVFNPAIKIKMTPHTPVVWIDEIAKVKDNYMLTVSTLTDKTKMNINAVDNLYLSGVSIRLHSMFGAKKAKEKIV